MNSILKHVVILKKDFSIENGMIIPAGADGFVITKEYLAQSNFSPNDYEQLLHEAEQAKSQGNLYVDFKNYGKCLSIPFDSVI